MAPQNNRSSRNTSSRSSNNKSASDKPIKTNDLLILGFIFLIVAIFVALYYIRQNKYKTKKEGFENSHDDMDIDSDQDSQTSTSQEKPKLDVKKGEFVIALFYTDWCPHCQHFKPEFKKAMSKLNGKMNNQNKSMRFEMVDCEAHKDLAKRYDVSGFPTVKILNDDKSVDEYNGDRTFDGLRKYLVSDD